MNVLAGCGSHVYHAVKPGETLYSIGWQYGIDYREVARWNHVPEPYTIYVGQRLRVSSPSNDHLGEVTVVERPLAPPASLPPIHSTQPSAQPSTRAVRPAALHTSPATPSRAPQRTTEQSPATTAAVRTQQRPAAVAPSAPTTAANTTKIKPLPKGAVKWRWPVSGKVVQRFSFKNSRKGIDIAGTIGQTVKAAARGRVVYSGNGLASYGNLLIIKHSDEFLSAYAHNKRLFVKEGDYVSSGDPIAEMGSDTNNAVRLHFEVRRNGKPVNPLRYLPKKS